MLVAVVVCWFKMMDLCVLTGENEAGPVESSGVVSGACVVDNNEIVESGVLPVEEVSIAVAGKEKNGVMGIV